MIETTEHVHQDYHEAYGTFHAPGFVDCPVMGECEAQMAGCSGDGQCQPDPFDVEVHEEMNYRILCDHCAGEIADDV